MTNIGNLNVSEMLVGFVYCLVDLLVIIDPVSEVFRRLFWILPIGASVLACVHLDDRLRTRRSLVMMS